MTESLLDNNMEKIKNLEENYKIITEKIQNAQLKCEYKTKEVKLLAATKTVNPYLINHAVSLGVKNIGENRVQELLSKYDEIEKNDVSIQFIGHLQTNKVKQIITKVDMIQSVDSVKLAQEISKQAQKNSLDMDVLVEINIGQEKSKSGIRIEQAEEFIAEISHLPGICVKGLMSIPPICDNKQQIRKYFSKIYEKFIDIRDKKLDNICMQFISMGMSDDYEEAILCGANIVRIGSALFGRRF